MQFKLAEPTLAYPILRVTSQTWEMGIYPTLFGVRVGGSPIDDPHYMVDGYCCGMNRSTVYIAFVYWLKKLSEFEENTRVGPVQKTFIRPHLKPIHKDLLFGEILGETGLTRPDIVKGNWDPIIDRLVGLLQKLELHLSLIHI